jgi:uncharacterized protein (DUF924 family)
MKHFPDEILDFWFQSIKPKDWFVKDDSLDRLIIERFTEHHKKASRGELFYWRETPNGRLAEIIILDQFSRNIYRNNIMAFQYDPMALTLAQEMVLLKLDEHLSQDEKSFVYMPYMHSESKIIHVEALKLFSALGSDDSLRYEKMHKEIIDRFNRFPHRNKILGRVSTPEEIEFLSHHSGF